MIKIQYSEKINKLVEKIQFFTDGGFYYADLHLGDCEDFSTIVSYTLELFNIAVKKKKNIYEAYTNNSDWRFYFIGTEASILEKLNKILKKVRKENIFIDHDIKELEEKIVKLKQIRDEK